MCTGIEAANSGSKFQILRIQKTTEAESRRQTEIWNIGVNKLQRAISL